MWRDLGITEQEWAAPPQAVRTVLAALQQQVRLMGIRFTAYEKQIASLREQVASIDDLKAYRYRRRLSTAVSSHQKAGGSRDGAEVDRRKTAGRAAGGEGSEARGGELRTVWSEHQGTNANGVLW
jgi:hypothetical protein